MSATPIDASGKVQIPLGAQRHQHQHPRPRPYPYPYPYPHAQSFECLLVVLCLTASLDLCLVTLACGKHLSLMVC